MFDPWYDGSNDYEGALLRTESEPPVFGDEGESGGIRMRVRIRYDNSEACDSSKYSLGAGTTAEIWQAWEKDPGLEVTLYLTAKDGREIDFVRVREGCDVIAWIDLPAGSLRGVNVTDMPEELLAHRTLEEARTLGVSWGDCYPVCYDDDLCIDDVLDSNGRLLWGNGTGDDLVIDESYEYARPKTEEEEENE